MRLNEVSNSLTSSINDINTNISTQINTVNKNIDSILNSTKRCTNVDTTLKAGSYDIGPDTQGTLPKSGYGLLFVSIANTSWIYQELYYTEPDGIEHYTRKKINSANWTSWRKYVSDRDLSKFWSLDGEKYGTYIPPNSNLDNFKTIGSYYNYLNVESKTITNNPSKLAFTMQVYCSTGYNQYYITQEFRNYSQDGGIYIRKYDEYSKSWSNWFKLVQNNDIVQLTIDFGEISLINGLTTRSYDFPARFPDYKLIGTLQPMVCYTNSHAYAQVTFTSYYNYTDTLRIYCDRSILARIFIRCLAIRN